MSSSYPKQTNGAARKTHETMATKQLTIYKLHFTSPLHIGDVRDSYDISNQTICSDVFYAAVTSCLASIGKSIPSDGDLGCTISSLFPFYQGPNSTEPVLFFPKPLALKMPKVITDAKKVKRVEWLDMHFFEQVLSGNQLYSNDEDIACVQGKYLSSIPIDKDFILSQVTRRIKVPQSYDEKVKPFFMDRVFFKDLSGLFFLCDGDTRLIDDALPVLQNEGLGTDRHIGYGFFTYQRETMTLTYPDNAARMVSLSMFIPSSQEQFNAMVNDDYAAYSLQRRGGWITTPPHTTIRKKAIYALSPGSVFTKIADGVCSAGSIVDLSPDNIDLQHPVWRCGKALFIPIK